MKRGLPLLFLPTLLFSGSPADRYGHHPYEEAPAASLASAGRYRKSGRVVQMRREAAEAFRAMAAAASSDGIRLIPISGFRSVAYQEGLWKKAVARRGSEEAAAKWVAPPGHSEHHAGWSLDLGDEEAPATDVDPSFETTKAFTWLQANASRFHFELSFPKNNPQGVSYEPWHWRFIGTVDARRTLHPDN